MPRLWLWLHLACFSLRDATVNWLRPVQVACLSSLPSVSDRAETDLAVLSQAGSGGAGDLHAALAAERAACEELRGRISDKEALMVLKKTLAEEKEAAAALRRKLG